MKKYTFILLCFLCYTWVQAQDGSALTKGAAARARMLEAFGGEEAVCGVKQFSYTLTRRVPGSPPSTTVYHLDLHRRHISVVSQTEKGKETQTIDSSGGWSSLGGENRPLTQKESDALRRTFFYNFIPMLQNEQLRFSYLRSDVYKDRPVDVVRVSDPAQESMVLDLFIDQENGQVLTSSRENEEGLYAYFADELEYTTVGEGIVFPLVYRIVVGGSVTSEGRFTDITLSR